MDSGEGVNEPKAERLKSELQLSPGNHNFESPCLELTFPPDYYFIQFLSFSYQVLSVLCFRTEIMGSFLFQTHLLQEAYLDCLS